ncbi:TetR/AcrR family transcriptional regulator [Tenggerimyces flavus]|uniref:TetR/AcrR family transcriptional regulator n=1 Tax=Tenggerimyces flavus TaxID=1708749 RepID=A0ABV7Y878_9ACTN|nr:TetR/AcrR family transcriptional regulator [Tenggerimyces flavus]MBM7783514.1 AcrR family transcriptional regulator [Tenggerimyces flavus]
MTEQLRADARHNRDQIMVAARALFATHGVHVPMEEVARAAGVGKATLYRRFPQREQLIEAVAFDVYRQLRALARDAVAEEPDSWAAVSRFLRDWIAVRLGLVHTGICEELPALLEANASLREARAEFFGLVDELADRAKADGELRSDVGGGDLALFANALVEQHDLPGPVQDEVRSRMLELLLDGLHVRNAPPLPGAPRRMADLEVHLPTNEG